RATPRPANPKGPSKTKPASPVKEETPIRILKIAECPSVSGQSTLTYHVGADRSDELFLRLYGNSGGGQFNRDWVPLAALRDRLKEWPGDRAMTTAVLRPLFRARSVNTPSFLFAVLIQEGLVAREGQSCTTGDAEPFLQSIQALIDAEVDLSLEVAVSPKPS
ncbi:MAG: hypothetical protein R6T96_07805, partial [Longimicrobiales bacterium]